VRHDKLLIEITRVVEDYSRRAAQRIAAKVKTGKISADTIAQIRAAEFEELNP